MLKRNIYFTLFIGIGTCITGVEEEKYSELSKCLIRGDRLVREIPESFFSRPRTYYKVSLEKYLGVFSKKLREMGDVTFMNFFTGKEIESMSMTALECYGSFLPSSLFKSLLDLNNTLENIPQQMRLGFMLNGDSPYLFLYLRYTEFFFQISHQYNPTMLCLE